jgi:hypothetical protein
MVLSSMIRQSISESCCYCYAENEVDALIQFVNDAATNRALGELVFNFAEDSLNSLQTRLHVNLVRIVIIEHMISK